jgi:hypothetical protein
MDTDHQTHELVGQANSIMVNLLFCQMKLTEELSHAYLAAAPSAPRSVEVEFRLQVVVISVSESTSNLSLMRCNGTGYGDVLMVPRTGEGAKHHNGLSGTYSQK